MNDRITPQVRNHIMAANRDDDTTLLQRQIDATDKQIDQLVTDEEIALVEAAQ